MKEPVPGQKPRKTMLLDLREWWTEVRKLSQDEINDEVACSALNTLYIMIRRGREKTISGISANSDFELEPGNPLSTEYSSKAQGAYDHLEKIVLSANGGIEQVRSEKKHGSVKLISTSAGLSKLQEVDRNFIARELNRARDRRRLARKERGLKKNRPPRYSFLRARGQSKL